MEGLLGHIVERVGRDVSQCGERRGPRSETQLCGPCNAVKLPLSEALPSSCHLPLLRGTLPKTRTPEWNEVTKCSGMLRNVGLELVYSGVNPGCGPPKLGDRGQVT